MIVACGCFCGSTDNLIRNFLKKNGYEDWMSIPIVKGKDKSRNLAKSLSYYPEGQMLDTFLSSASKWAVIIGYDGESCRWSDLSHGGAKASIEAELIVQNFS